MAHPADRGVERVDRLDRGADGLANPRAEREDATRTEIIETAIAALRLDDGVEIAAISDIDRQRADAVDIDPDAARRDIGRHVGQPDRGDAIARCPISDIDDPCGHLDAQPRSEEHTSELQSLMRISYAV